MLPTPLEALYTQFPPLAGQPGANSQRELGEFYAFNLEELRPEHRHCPPLPFNRQAFSKVGLTYGGGRLELTDRTVEVEPNTLLLTTPRLAFRWVPRQTKPMGCFCLFTDEFLVPAKGSALVAELPLLHPGAYPLVPLTPAQLPAVEVIFQKMQQEAAGNYAYKYDLLRTYLVELLHLMQKYHPLPSQALVLPAAGLAGQFADLLEQQFPLHGPAPPPALRSAADYADQLAVHVVHLNRVLKQVTGHTTTALIGQRVAQQAKLLLRHTPQSVGEVAAQLGFADAAHFCTFFKRVTKLTPGDFRR